MRRAGWLLCGTLLFVVGVGAGSGGTLLWLRQEKKPPERWEATIYLPAPRSPANPGGSYSQEDWNDAVGLLVKEFEGATLGAEVEGLWRNPDGKFDREMIRPVIVSFETDRLEDFRRVLDEVGRRLKQQAVYARFERPRVELRRLGP